MNLKGDYSGEVTYSVDDVVRWENGDIFVLQKPCAAGTAPVCTRYWGKILGETALCISLMVDMSNAFNTAIESVAATVPTNVGEESIVLKSGDNEYLVSVDATGDSPEVIAELIEPEEVAEGGET